jgi:hypothetical protein
MICPGMWLKTKKIAKISKFSEKEKMSLAIEK